MKLIPILATMFIISASFALAIDYYYPVGNPYDGVSTYYDYYGNKDFEQITPESRLTSPTVIDIRQGRLAMHTGLTDFHTQRLRVLDSPGLSGRNVHLQEWSIVRNPYRPQHYPSFGMMSPYEEIVLGRLNPIQYGMYGPEARLELGFI